MLDQYTMTVDAWQDPVSQAMQREKLKQPMQRRQARESGMIDFATERNNHDVEIS